MMSKKEEKITKKIKENIQPIKEGLLKYEEFVELLEEIFNYLGNESEKNPIWKLRFRKFYESNYGKTIKVESNDYVSTKDFPFEKGLSGWNAIEPVLDYYFNFIGQKKIIKKLKDEELWVESRSSGDELHLFVGNRKGERNKVHLVFASTGEIRIDKNDSSPDKLLNKIETILTTKNGKVIKSVFEFNG
jgi:hypothetical protein